MFTLTQACLLETVYMLMETAAPQPPRCPPRLHCQGIVQPICLAKLRLYPLTPGCRVLPLRIPSVHDHTHMGSSVASSCFQGKGNGLVGLTHGALGQTGWKGPD